MKYEKGEGKGKEGTTKMGKEGKGENCWIPDSSLLLRF
jgi:hypothetical protein